MSQKDHVGEQNSLYQELRNGSLPQTREVVEQDDVIMDSDGSFSYANSPPREGVLGRRRKELVLGLNGFEEHSLEEANRLINKHSDSPLSRIRNFFSRRKA